MRHAVNLMMMRVKDTFINNSPARKNIVDFGRDATTGRRRYAKRAARFFAPARGRQESVSSRPRPRLPTAKLLRATNVSARAEQQVIIALIRTQYLTAAGIFSARPRHADGRHSIASSSPAAGEALSGRFYKPHGHSSSLARIAGRRL